jgi:hypothetical protein
MEVLIQAPSVFYLMLLGISKLYCMTDMNKNTEGPPKINHIWW